MTTKTKKQKKFITDLEMVPPDGKYGWVIVISYAIANVSEQRKNFFCFTWRFFFFKILTFEQRSLKQRLSYQLAASQFHKACFSKK